MPKVPRSISVGLLALTAAVAGCGSGGSDKLSSEEYAAAVTRICASNASELQKLVDTTGGNFLARKGDKFIEVTDRNLTRLESLQPPPELETKAHQLVVAAEATRDRLVIVVHAAKKHPGTVNLGSSGLIAARRRTIEAATNVGASC